MRHFSVAALAVACFAGGVLSHVLLAQGAKPVFRVDLVKGKDAREAGSALLDGALQLAEGGSWERIAVGRAWYLSGDKPKGQQIEQALTLKPGDDSGMVEYGALTNLNNDRSKAEELFEKAMKKNPREFWHWVTAGSSYLGVPPQ